MALLSAHKWISYGLSETFARCLCACVSLHKINAVNKSKSKWTLADRKWINKKWQIIVSLGLPSEFLTWEQGLWQMLMGDCKSALTIYKEKLAHYANSCIILPRHLLILRSGSAINFIRYSLRLYKDSDLHCRHRAEFRRSSVMWCETHPFIGAYLKWSSGLCTSILLTVNRAENRSTVRSPVVFSMPQ